ISVSAPDTTDICTLSLHDALPISVNAMLLNEFLKEHGKVEEQGRKLPEQEVTIAEQRKSFQASITNLEATVARQRKEMEALTARDRKSTRLNSSHQIISYAVFCLK